MIGFICLSFSTIKGDGPIRGIVGISTGAGEVRGYCGSPMLGDMHITEAVGLGAVQVVKNHPDWPNPYNGITGAYILVFFVLFLSTVRFISLFLDTTAIRHGDIDRDIGEYIQHKCCVHLFFILQRDLIYSVWFGFICLVLMNEETHFLSCRCIFGGKRTTLMCSCSGNINQWYSLYSSWRIFNRTTAFCER